MPPTPPQAASSAIVSAPAKDQPNAWHWTIWMAIVLPFVTMAVLVWQLSKLDPARYCGVAFGMVNLTGAGAIDALKAGFACLSDLSAIYKTNTLALIVLVGIGNIGIIYTTLKARINVEAWGFRGGVGSEDGK